MHIVVIEDDGGLRGVLRLLMEDTGCVATGDANPKTYDGIDIVVIGPNASQVNMEAIKSRHLPFIRIGFGQDIDALMRWTENMIREISRRADRCIREDRAV